MGSDVFMRELRATESSIPWCSRTGERIHLYLDQFGSFRAELDTTGAVLMAVQKGAKASLRVANLLDEESDEEAPSVLVKVQPERGMDRPVQPLLGGMSSPEEGGDRERGGKKFPLEDSRVLTERMIS